MRACAEPEWFFFGHRVGKFSHVSVVESLVKTMLFGAAWWLPQNEERHEEIEAEVDKTRFKDKACGVRFADEGQWKKEKAMSYEMLLSPMNIGKMTVKNRLVMTPAETSMGDMTGKATERMISYYEERAKGGVGLIITATTRVNDLDSASTFNQLAMSHDYHIEPARRLADRIHSHGAKIRCSSTTPRGQGYSISTYALPVLIPLTKAVPAARGMVWKSTDALQAGGKGPVSPGARAVRVRAELPCVQPRGRHEPPAHKEARARLHRRGRALSEGRDRRR